MSVCYNPEFVALGSVVAGFERPELILIGESHPAAGSEVERILRRVVRNNPPVHHMSFVSAEIAKLALNNFLTIKISFANFLSQICSRIDGADIDAITSALADDSRIGGKYLRAGPPFGGPCFPRDVIALAALAQQTGQPMRLFEEISKSIGHNSTISPRRYAGIWSIRKCHPSGYLDCHTMRLRHTRLNPRHSP